MKTRLVLGEEPKKFNELLNKKIEEVEKEGYIIRDIKYGDNEKRFSALVMIVKLAK